MTSFLSRSYTLLGSIALLGAVLFLAGCSRAAFEGPPPRPETGTDTLVATASVTVKERQDRRLTHMAVVPAHLVVAAGEVVALTAIGYDAAGIQRPDVRFRWSMANPAAGSISSSGVFRARQSIGTFPDAISVVGVQVTPQGRVEMAARATVSVTRPAAARAADRLLVLPEEVEVEKGGQVRLSALAMDRAGILVPGVEVTWTMSDARAGSVDARGLFSAGDQEGAFPQAIRAAAEGAGPASAFVSVRVTAGPPVPRLASVALLPQAVALQPGDYISFSAVALDQQGSSLSGVDVAWSLSDPKVGELNDRGKLRAGEKPGTYVGSVQATVSWRQGSDVVSVSAAATVTILERMELRPPEGTLASLSLYPTEVILAPGESTRLSLLGLDGGGRILRNVKVEWSVPEGIATVTPSGRITAAGQAGVYRDAIKARVEQKTEGGVLKWEATATLIVTGRLARATVTPQQMTVEPGERVQYAVVAYDENGVRLVDVVVRWSVTDQRAGTVDRAGLFKAGTEAGDFPDVVRAEVVQRRPLP